MRPLAILVGLWVAAPGAAHAQPNSAQPNSAQPNSAQPNSAQPNSAQRDPCATVACSGAGTCVVEHDAAHCLCDAGRAAVGHACVEVEEPDALRLRRDPSAGQRVADLAMSQVERWRPQVGRGVEGLALEPLGRYLEADEWWCTDFVAWVYAAAGVPFTQGALGGWLVTNNVAMRLWFAQKELWLPRRALGDYVPQPGDYVRIDTDGGGHSAIVHHVDGSTLVTVEGNVSGQVEVGRYHHYRTHRLIDGVGRLQPANAPPEVDAGEDGEVILPDPFPLAGEVTDDGPEARLAVSWDVVTGPPGARLGDATAPATEVSFRHPGTYRLRLRGHDGEHDVADTVEVRAVANRPPSVAARVAAISAFDAAAELRGEAVDDGVAEPLTLRWSQVEGPGPASFDTPSAASTRVVVPTPGRYLLRLEADDGHDAAHADVELVVPAWPGGCSAAPTRSSRAPGALALLVLLALARRR